MIIGVNSAPLENAEDIKKESEILYRLPKTVLPSKYTIELTPHILEEEKSSLEHDRFTFKAISSIILKSTENDVKEITLHVNSLKIDEEKTVLHKKGYPNSKIEISSQKLTVENDKYVIELKEALEKGKEYQLNFDYIGQMENDMHGFYRSSYKDSKGKER